MFVPAYYDGQAPFGVWHPYRATILDSWANTGETQWDFAILNMHENNGNKLANVVGANGLMINAGYYNTYIVWGYPQQAPYNGGRPYYCDRVRNQPYGSGLTMVYCPVVIGWSGGPWLLNYNYDIQLGYINGINATQSNPVGQAHSAYFDDDVIIVYNAAIS